MAIASSKVIEDDLLLTLSQFNVMFLKLEAFVSWKLPGSKKFERMYFFINRNNDFVETDKHISIVDYNDCVRLNIYTAFIGTIKKHIKTVCPSETKCAYINASIIIDINKDENILIPIADCIELQSKKLFAVHELTDPKCAFCEKPRTDCYPDVFNTFSSESSKFPAIYERNFNIAVQNIEKNLISDVKNDFVKTLKEDLEYDLPPKIPNHGEKNMDGKYFETDTPEPRNRSHASSKPTYCNSCKQDFDTDAEFEKHVRGHIEYFDNCTATKYLRASFNSNMTDIIINCSICESKITNVNDGKKHIIANHPDFVNKNKPNNICPICSATTYKILYDLVRHIRVAHLHGDEYRCILCKKQYTYDVGFKLHMITFHKDYCVQNNLKVSTS